MSDKYYYEHTATEAEWKNWYNSTESKLYKNTSTTLDLIIVKFINNKLSVLLQNRDTHPFKNQLALPGTYLHDNENKPEESIDRIYKTKLNLNYFQTLKSNQIHQLAAYAHSNRDPRGRVVSIAYIIYDNLAEAHNGFEWFELNELIQYQNLAFDHNEIISDAYKRIQDQFAWSPFSFYSLHQPFTLRDLVQLKANLNNTNYKLINRANLRKKMLPLIQKYNTVNNITYYTPKL